jgi:N-acetylneuraminate synthase
MTGASNPTHRTAPVFCADVSSNHNRDLDRCLAFIRTAAALGCGAVKFQLFRIDQLFAPEVLARSEEHRRRRAWELPREWIPRLAEECRDQGVGFVCTPFDLEAVDVLAPHVQRLKVASYELLWHDLLRACGATGRPVVLSTGMATLDEVARAVEVVRAAGCQDLTLLHCASSYPTPPGECNLAAIETLRRAFGCPVGWSDHSRSPAVIRRAIRRWSAAFVEFHLDLDGSGAEHALGHCWLPGEIAPLIDGTSPDGRVKDPSPLDGDGVKEPSPGELHDREWRADPVDGLRPLRHVRAAFARGEPERSM